MCRDRRVCECVLDMRGERLSRLWCGGHASASGRRKDTLESGNDLDRLEPRILENHLGRGPRLGIRVQHALDDAPTFARDEVGQWWRRGGSRVELEVRAKGGVRRLGDAPWQLLEVHAVEDDGAGPNVDQASVVLCFIGTREQQRGSARGLGARRRDAPKPPTHPSAQTARAQCTARIRTIPC